MFRQRRSQQRPIDQEEWDFSGIDPADAEVCLRYEFAREVENPLSYFAAFSRLEAAPFAFRRLPISAGMADGAGETFWREAKNTYIRVNNILAPDEGDGYRELLTGMYFLHPEGDIRAYPASLKSTPWQKLDPDWQHRLSMYAAQESTGFFAHEPGQSENFEAKSQDLVARLEDLGKRRLFVALVDWRKNNAELIAGFSRWLDESRPAELPSKIAVGRQSTLDRLNALSALRLRHAMNANDAVKHTKHTLGKAIYSERPAWERARKRAVALFHFAYPDAGGPVSAAKVGASSTSTFL